MKKIISIVALGFALASSPAVAQSLTDLYNDALAEADAGSSKVDDSDWQFRDGNVREGCDLMEQGRVHYEKAYQDMQQMDEMVNDPGNGFGADDQKRIMDWIGQQRETLDPLAKRMADIYYEKCAPQ